MEKLMQYLSKVNQVSYYPFCANRSQARIQDFAQGGATAKRSPEARGHRVAPIKIKKSADLVHY